MGATTTKIGKSFDDLRKQFTEYLTGLHWAHTVNDIVILNPETKECKVFKAKFEGEHGEQFVGLEETTEGTRYPHSASIAGIYGPKPKPGELVGWCYFDI